ncbi:MAG: M23 family metallopeptidase, partial [Stellaceae bacterium]
PGKDFRVVPVDPLTNFQPTGRNFVKNVNGEVITSLIQPFSRTPQERADLPVIPPPGIVYTDKLLPGGSGVVYFDVTYADMSAVPRLISHRLFVDLSERGVTGHTAFTAPVPVSCQKPVALSPPLRGPGRFDANGCCAVINAHRGSAAGLHLDGELRTAQQFAIDWVQIGKDGRCCTGDPRRLQSWIGYGQSIFAAASGTVFSIVRNMPDQEPVGTLRNIKLATLAGNSIIEDIGRGRFILYAHMQPGSIPALLRPGTHIEVGQMIGRLGNSGNSDAPHLHFHVMDSPSALISAGLPFVFNRLQVEGHIVGAEGRAVNALLTGKPLPITTNGSGTQLRKMPLSSTIFGF